MATDRKAEVTWHGDLMSGSGRIDSVSSGAIGGLDVDWVARSEDAQSKTSPEELIAAAHSSCFAMALSNEVAKAGGTPVALDITADVTLGQVDGAPTITTIQLTVRGEVEGLDAAGFEQAAQAAKAGCPVSKALTGVEITVDAALE